MRAYTVLCAIFVSVGSYLFGEFLVYVLDTWCIDWWCRDGQATIQACACSLPRMH